jgi:hypothetical protein
MHGKNNGLTLVTCAPLRSRCKTIQFDFHVTPVFFAGRFKKSLRTITNLESRSEQRSLARGRVLARRLGIEAILKFPVTKPSGIGKPRAKRVTITQGRQRRPL